MTRIENDCCDCGFDDCYSCSLREVEHHYCDICGEEIVGEESVYIGGDEMHWDCAHEAYPEYWEDDDEEVC